VLINCIEATTYELPLQSVRVSHRRRGSFQKLDLLKVDPITDIEGVLDKEEDTE